MVNGNGSYLGSGGGGVLAISVVFVGVAAIFIAMDSLVSY